MHTTKVCAFQDEKLTGVGILLFREVIASIKVKSHGPEAMMIAMSLRSGCSIEKTYTSVFSAESCDRYHALQTN